MSGKKKPAPARIAENRKAAFNYFMEERLEAGVVLEGWEVKAVREGNVQITDGFVMIRNEEVFMMGCRIYPLKTASTHIQPQELRSKKLLLKKPQIRRLIGKVEQRGYTLVVLNLHWTRGKVKAEVALARGKASHDRRATIKEREDRRAVEQALKTRNQRS